tara:strand:+ start:433 stop:1482 length:1050 start_codon:yes stop_codon:yes gene_type:complete
MSSTNQRNIFIDTEQYHGSDNKVQLLFPSQTLVVPQGFGMKLSLQQFTMKKTFYNINEYNNTFYIYTPDPTNPATVLGLYQELKIPEGDYYTFGATSSVANSLCKGIQTAFIVGGITDVTVAYDEIDRKLTITSPFLGTTIKKILFLQVPPSRQVFIPNNVTPNGLFSDVAEIFGGKSIQQDLSGQFTPVESMKKTLDTYTSFFPASLYSMENLRLVVNLGNSNLETPNMDANSSTSVCITSQTFATIPLQTGTFDGLSLIEPAMIIYKDDGDEVFSIKLQQNHIDNCQFSIVDGKGRPIAEVDTNQYKNGQMSYQMVLRYEIIEEPYVANQSNMPSGNRTGNLKPQLN